MKDEELQKLIDIQKIKSMTLDEKMVTLTSKMEMLENHMHFALKDVANNSQDIA